MKKGRVVSRSKEIEEGERNEQKSEKKFLRKSTRSTIKKVYRYRLNLCILTENRLHSNLFLLMR